MKRSSQLRWKKRKRTETRTETAAAGAAPGEKRQRTQRKDDDHTDDALAELRCDAEDEWGGGEIEDAPGDHEEDEEEDGDEDEAVHPAYDICPTSCPKCWTRPQRPTKPAPPLNAG